MNNKLIHKLIKLNQAPFKTLKIELTHILVI